ncbi:MAG: diversity-generating retroelement protein Avd [Bacteroidia bacterium]
MDTTEREDVVSLTYDLLLYIIPQLAKYPRTQKFLLADRIQTYLMEIMETLVEAYYSPRQDKSDLLRKANLQLEKLRYLVRLSRDLECINIHRFGVISGKVDTIGRSIGGWLKSLG